MTNAMGRPGPCEMRCEYCVSAGSSHGVWPHVAGPAVNSLNATPVAAFLVLVINAMAQGMRRGPHHPTGQSPVDQHHHHYKPTGSSSMTEDNQLLHDTKHIEEDNHVLSAEEISKMSSEELEFHYFSAHDFDRNSKLDGLELLKAIYHTMEHDDEYYEKSEIEPEPDEFDGYVALVDKTLVTDDTDGDGFVSYAEYRAAREKQPVERTPRVIAAPHP